MSSSAMMAVMSSVDELVGAGGVDCPLCDVESLRASDAFAENEHCVFTSNTWNSPREVLPGSGIIVPITHRESPFELSADEWSSTRALALVVKSMIDGALAPDGYNLAWNVKRAAGQELAHTHLHVIPRFADEPFAGRGARWWLKSAENQRPGPTRRGTS